MNKSISKGFWKLRKWILKKVWNDNSEELYLTYLAIANIKDQTKDVEPDEVDELHLEKLNLPLIEKDLKTEMGTFTLKKFLKNQYSKIIK